MTARSMWWFLSEAGMRARVIVLALALFVGAQFAKATPFSDAADRLNGEWQGADFVLKVDAKRAQASIDPAHPFEWERFLIKEVAGGEIVFAIGAELFQAKLDSDTLTLTGTSFRGPRVLFRQTGIRGTTE
jgi:hypothetical protein